ncbi:MAG: DUF2069 domain-containing protein [Gammaproteobacteria bacterium]|nr:DUF2069 domain-containing protein [Gammaproteobacteria bacterium]
MTKIQWTRTLALLGYFGLLAVLLNWFLWIAPPKQVPRALLLIVLVVPLLIPLRGLLYEKRYTYQWTCFLALFYFIIGVDVGFNRLGPERLMGVLTVAFSLMFFTGAMYYAKYTGTGKKRQKKAPKTRENSTH